MSSKDFLLRETDFPHAPDLEALWTWTRRQPWGDAELAEAMKAFVAASGPTINPQAQQQHDLRFIDWFHLDRPVASLGATPLALWLQATGEPDSPLAHTVVGTFRVTRTVPHSRVVLSGLAGGGSYRIKDKVLSVGLKPGQLAFGRLYPHGEYWLPGASLLAVDEAIATALRPLAELAAIADGLTLERLLFKPQ